LHDHLVENDDDKVSISYPRCRNPTGNTNIDHNALQALYSILILSSCLQHPERIVQEDTDTEYAQKILFWLSKYSIPTVGLFAYVYVFKGSWFSRENYRAPSYCSVDDKDTKSHIGLEHFQVRSKIIFSIMEYLDAHFLTRGTRIDEHILLSWIAYTNVDDPWTSKVLQEEAGELLNRHQEQSLTPDFIIDHVLAGFIRPLFSSSRAPAITSQGRKAINASSISLNQQNNMDSSNKAWKSRDVHAVAVFEWAVGHMDVGSYY
jgi:hypothetical protein